MAYFERRRVDSLYPPERQYHVFGRLLCDDCAVEEVPFEAKAPPAFQDQHPDADQVYLKQVRPWCWTPHYGKPCDACKRPT